MSTKVRDFALEVLKVTLVVPVVAAILAWIWNRITKAKWFDLPLNQRPWFIFSLVCIVMMAAIALTVWLWESRPFVRFRDSYRNDRWRLFGKLLLSLLIPILFAATVAFLISPGQVQDTEAEALFPQATELGAVFIRAFATNGKVDCPFSEDTPVGGPHGYVKITLQTYGTTVNQNAGWVMSFIRGADMSDQKQLRFLIRGEFGGEKIGIKIKDAHGVEIALMLDGQSYLRDNKITTDWQEASIPLSHFGNVDFQVVDSLTLFTDGSISLTKPQTIYVGGFRLLPTE
jgi:hypothetical protein